MLMDRNTSMLLLVDVQERLLPAMHEAQRVLDNTIWLMRVAQRLGVPVAASEQYPRGLGHLHGGPAWAARARVHRRKAAFFLRGGAMPGATAGR